MAERIQDLSLQGLLDAVGDADGTPPNQGPNSGGILNWNNLKSVPQILLDLVGGASILSGDVSGPLTGNTVGKLLNRSLSLSVPNHMSLMYLDLNTNPSTPTWKYATLANLLSLYGGLDGDVTGPFLESEVIALRGRNLTDQAPDALDLMYWDISDPLNPKWSHANLIELSALSGLGGGVVAFGNAFFAGPSAYTEVPFSPGLSVNYVVNITPEQDTSASVGEFWVPETYKLQNSFRVYNTGGPSSGAPGTPGRTRFSWSISVRGQMPDVAGPASGDISGNYPGPITVAKIQNIPVSTTAPTDGQVLKYSGTSGKWEPSADESGGGGVAVPYLEQTFYPGSHQLTIPIGVTEIRVSGCGAGGGAGGGVSGSGGSYTYFAKGGGGAGGQFAEDVIIPATPGATLYISVGGSVGEAPQTPTQTGTLNGVPGTSGQATTLSGAATFVLLGGGGGGGATYNPGIIPGGGGVCPAATSPKKTGGSGGAGGGDMYPPGSVSDGSAGEASEYAEGGLGGVCSYSIVYGQGAFSGGAGGGGSWGVGASGHNTILNGYHLTSTSQDPYAGWGGGGSSGSLSHPYYLGGGSGSPSWNPGKASGSGFIRIEWGY